MTTNKLTIELDLDAATPEEAPALVRQIAAAFQAAADRYAEAPSELAAAWGDENAGLVWKYLADRMAATGSILERRADILEETVKRHT